MKHLSFILICIIHNLALCNNLFQTEINSDVIKNYHKEGVNYIYQYSITSDSSFLDSALITINKGLEYCNNSDYNLAIRKLCILSMQNKYDDAIIFIKQLNPNVLNNTMGNFYYNSIYFRFHAMNASYKNNLNEKNEYLDKALNNIKDFISSNDDSISIFFNSNNENIFKGKYWLALTQYEYYYFIRHGNIETSTFISELKKKLPSIEKILIYNNDFLTTDFMEFIGI